MSSNTETAITDEAPKQSPPIPIPIPNLLSLFPKLNFQFPFLPSNPKPKPKPKPVPEAEPEPEEPNPMIKFVRFPQSQGVVVPSSNLQAEPDHSVSARTSNPVILWQVYAIAAAMISTWIWARWNERKGRGGNDESTEGRHSDDANH